MELTKENFSNEISSGLVLVDFYATWCAPCKAIVPILESIATENKIKLCKVDIDQNQELAMKFKIQSVPVVILFQNGKEVKRSVGLKTKNQLKLNLELLNETQNKENGAQNN